MSQNSREIEALAEEAIREAGGDWGAAGNSFRAQLEKKEELGRELWQKIVFQELRAAAQRLGATTKVCPHCSEDIPLDAVTCRFCQRSTEPAPAGTAGPPPASAVAKSGPIIRNFTLLTGWVLIVLIIILIFAFSR